MKISQAIAAGLATLVLTSTPLLAHPGHGNEISAEAATKRASIEVDRLVEEGKLEKSWALQRKPGGAQMRAAGEDQEWVVTFDNSAAVDAAKRKLYVFLTANGDYVAANFSGK